ncbi:MAG: metal ABC transporter solute-binding protein, Zn/Mn family [Opitutaceae bacterium]
MKLPFTFPLRSTLALMAALVGATPASAATEAPAKKLKSPYKAVATTAMVKDLVVRIGGQHAKVEGLMGEGVDPHLYKPTRDDVQQLLTADVVFYSGLMLEGRMTDTFLKVARRGTPVFPVTELLDEKYLLEPEEFQGHTDPHVWMDVQAWTKAMEAAAKALSELDPANAATYRANADAYAKELKQLDDYARKSISSIPEQQRVLITAHDAFNYFGRAYNLKVFGIQGISTESEAGVQDINKLVDRIVENKIPAIFVETSVSDKNVRAIIEGAKTRGRKVEIGGTLFSDAMGAPGTYEGTYTGMIDHNVTIITRALGGNAPERGLNGKLRAGAK